MKKALSITENHFYVGVGIQADFYKMMQDIFGIYNNRKHNRCQYYKEYDVTHNTIDICQLSF